RSTAGSFASGPRASACTATHRMPPRSRRRSGRRSRPTESSLQPWRNCARPRLREPVRIAAVTTTVSPVIAQQPAQDGKPGITYRQAGERAVLVEYGEMVFDLALNFLVLAANDALGQQPPHGLVETAPGFRSMLVSYDPFALSSSELVDHLQAVH